MRKDGSIVWVHNSVAALRNADGGLQGLHAVSLDISERKRAESEREMLLGSERSARADAERAGRMKDEFLATLSHELRTPLNAVLGWAQILRKKQPTAEMLERGLAVIDRNARLQSQLIADLLDIQCVELPLLVMSALEAVRPAAEAKGVELTSHAADAGSVVQADPARIQQVVWNLVSNAVKFTPRGGRVCVSLARVEDHVQINVSDTGKGLSADFVPHIFERFRQADSSAAREHGGLGIGLSIVKQLVDLHGGTVRAASAGDGQGATFTVLLPLATVQLASDENLKLPHRPASAAVASQDAPDLTGLRILVVDDEPDSRELFGRVLEECGAEILIASSADAAIATIEAERIDVMLSDIGLPGRDG